MPEYQELMFLYSLNSKGNDYSGAANIWIGLLRDNTKLMDESRFDLQPDSKRK